MKEDGIRRKRNEGKRSKRKKKREEVLTEEIYIERNISRKK